MQMLPSPKTHYSAQIVERRDITANLWIIRIDPGGPFQYLPGQYATLGMNTPAGHFERPYSIVSSPHEKYPEFFIELVPQGEVTPLLHACQVGGEITLRKAARGIFALKITGGSANHFMLSTVTGVSPFVSHIRYFRQQVNLRQFPSAHKLFLIEGASRSWELGYRDELEKMASEVSWLRYVPTVSRPDEEKEWRGETGRVDDVVRKYSDSWGLTPENSLVYLCGHPGMIDNCTGIVKRRGWKEGTIKSEAFFVPSNEPPIS